MSESSSDAGGCSCVGLIIFILLMWAILFGLPINDKVLNIDIFPPSITYK